MRTMNSSNRVTDLFNLCMSTEDDDLKNYKFFASKNHKFNGNTKKYSKKRADK